MDQNNQSTLVKPLAASIARPHLPRFESLYKAPLAPRVSALRVNRALWKRDLAGAQITPSGVKGERIFEPSAELTERLRRLQETEAIVTLQKALPPLPSIPPVGAEPRAAPGAAPTPTPAPVPPFEAKQREDELAALRSTYQEQVGQLKQREDELQQAVLQLTDKLTETQKQLTAQAQGALPSTDITEMATRQKERITQLEGSFESLQNELNAAREAWREKTEQLDAMKKEAAAAPSEESKQLGQQINEQQQKINALNQKRNEMVQRIHKEQSELKRLQNAVTILSSQNKEKEELIRQQRLQLDELQRDKEKVSRFANELVGKLAQVENLRRVESQITVAKAAQAKPKYAPKVIKAVAKAKEVPLATDRPNTISGIVYDAQGQPQANALVVIKNKDQQPQRALRTSKLGEFTTSSPLANGIFRIEAQKDELKFDIIEIELTGKIFEPIEIKALP